MSCAKGCISTGNVLIPCLQEHVSIICNMPLYFSQLVRTEPL